MFVLSFSMSFLSLPPSGLDFKSTFFAVASVFVGQGIRTWIWISFLESFFLVVLGRLNYFHALMLVLLWEWKLSLLNDIGKDERPTTDSDKIMTFSWGRIFEFVLSVGVKTEVKTLVMGIAWPASFEKDCFDMLKSIWFGNLVRLFSSFKTYW